MQVRDYLKLGVVQNAVNLPSLSHEEYKEIAPYIEMAERLGLFLSHAIPGNLETIQITYAGRLAQGKTELIRNAAICGVFANSEVVNRINAAAVAQERGIRIQEDKKEFTTGGSGSTLKITLHSSGGDASASATVLHGTSPRLLTYDGIDIEAPLQGTLVMIRNHDVPGVVGRIGTILGEHSLNIANFALGRSTRSQRVPQGQALAVVQIDTQEMGKRPPQSKHCARWKPSPAFAWWSWKNAKVVHEAKRETNAAVRIRVQAVQAPHGEDSEVLRSGDHRVPALRRPAGARRSPRRRSPSRAGAGTPTATATPSHPRQTSESKGELGFLVGFFERRRGRGSEQQGLRACIEHSGRACSDLRRAPTRSSRLTRSWAAVFLALFARLGQADRDRLLSGWSPSCHSGRSSACPASCLHFALNVFAGGGAVFAPRVLLRGLLG